MNVEPVSLAIPNLIAASVAIGIAIYAWRMRAAPGAPAFAVFMAAVAWWSTFNLFELIAADLAWKFFWLRVEYLGIVTVPVAWLAFALLRTGVATPWRLRAAVAIEPVVMLLLVMTNGWHELVWRVDDLRTEGALLVTRDAWGPWYWINVGYAWLALAGGSLVLLRLAVQSRQHRRQQIGLLAAVAIPWVGHIVYISGYSPWPHLDPVPMAAPLAGVVIAWSQFRFRVLDLVPMARALIVERMNDGLVVIDTSGRVIDVNPAACAIFGQTQEQLIGASVARWLPRLAPLLDGHAVLGDERQLELATAAGRVYDVRAIAIAEDGGRHASLVTLRDITDQKARERQLTWRAHYDPLTQLANRALFLERLDAALLRAARTRLAVGVLFIDLDGFKEVNDRYGHDIGDDVLVAVADAIRDCVRGADTVARLAGDEFTVLVEDIAGATNARPCIDVARRILARLEEPTVVPGAVLHVTPSIGIAVGDHRTPGEQLLRQADLAMYAAKRAGKHGFRVFDAEHGVIGHQVAPAAD